MNCYRISVKKGLQSKNKTLFYKMNLNNCNALNHLWTFSKFRVLTKEMEKFSLSLPGAFCFVMVLKLVKDRCILLTFREKSFHSITVIRDCRLSLLENNRLESQKLRRLSRKML